MLFELCYNEMEFKSKNFGYVVAACLLYLFVNYLFYINMDKTGKGVYPGLTFDNWETIGYLIIAVACMSMGFWFGYWYTNKYKKPKWEKKHE